MRKLFTTLRNSIGISEGLFLVGIIFLYIGVAVQFNHALAQIATGIVFIFVGIKTAQP